MQPAALGVAGRVQGKERVQAVVEDLLSQGSAVIHRGAVHHVHTGVDAGDPTGGLRQGAQDRGVRRELTVVIEHARRQCAAQAAEQQTHFDTRFRVQAELLSGGGHVVAVEDVAQVGQGHAQGHVGDAAADGFGGALHKRLALQGRGQGREAGHLGERHLAELEGAEQGAAQFAQAGADLAGRGGGVAGAVRDQAEAGAVDQAANGLVGNLAATADGGTGLLGGHVVDGGGCFVGGRGTVAGVQARGERLAQPVGDALADRGFPLAQELFLLSHAGQIRPHHRGAARVLVDVVGQGRGVRQVVAGVLHQGVAAEVFREGGDGVDGHLVAFGQALVLDGAVCRGAGLVGDGVGGLAGCLSTHGGGDRVNARGGGVTGQTGSHAGGDRVDVGAQGVAPLLRFR